MKSILNVLFETDNENIQASQKLGMIQSAFNLIASTFEHESLCTFENFECVINERFLWEVIHHCQSKWKLINEAESCLKSIESGLAKAKLNDDQLLKLLDVLFGPNTNL